MCFRLHFAKNSTTINTAGATVRQLVSLIFERVVTESASSEKGPQVPEINLEDLKIPSGVAPKSITFDTQ